MANEYIQNDYGYLVGGIGFASRDICSFKTWKKTINLLLCAVATCNEFSTILVCYFYS